MRPGIVKLVEDVGRDAARTPLAVPRLGGSVALDRDVVGVDLGTHAIEQDAPLAPNGALPDPSRQEAFGQGLDDRPAQLVTDLIAVVGDLQRDRDVALKVLRSELSTASGAERFDREIRIAARLVHPNILPVLDSGRVAGSAGEDGHLWYTMPFVEGESLRDRLKREKQLPLGEAVRLTSEVADALAHAHSQNILHRDIKPENILLAAGHALVADFGIARALGASNERITTTGLALGTPGYMSPEQSTGERELDARSDLYALASVSYEMLAGEAPFTGPSAQAVIALPLKIQTACIKAKGDLAYVCGEYERLYRETETQKRAEAERMQQRTLGGIVESLR